MCAKKWVRLRLAEDKLKKEQHFDRDWTWQIRMVGWLEGLWQRWSRRSGRMSRPPVRHISCQPVPLMKTPDKWPPTITNTVCKRHALIFNKSKGPTNHEFKSRWRLRSTWLRASTSWSWRFPAQRAWPRCTWGSTRWARRSGEDRVDDELAEVDGGLLDSGAGVSGNSRSRSFPRMEASDSLSRTLGMDFFIPFPFPNFRNGFFSFPSRSRNLGMDIFHSLPVPEFREWIFSLPSRSRILGMDFFLNPQKSFPLTPGMGVTNQVLTDRWY